jgi:hypothetical protein
MSDTPKREVSRRGFWWLKTIGRIRPDSHFVHRASCQEGRTCCEPSESQEAQ